MAPQNSWLLALSSLALLNLCSSELVPVLMWGTHSPNEPVPALQKTSQSLFRDEISNKLKSFSRIVVFAEQSLSPEDFSQRDKLGKNAFKHLSKIRESSQVNYLPSVQNPVKALQHVSDDVTEISIEELQEKNFEVPKSQVVIVNLNDALDNEQRVDMLTRHDELISSIYGKLVEKYGDVLAVYTGQHASWIASSGVHSRKTRAVEDTTPNRYIDNSTIMFYTSADVNVTVINKETKQTSHTTFSVSYSATNSSGVITLNGTGVNGGVNFSVRFVFEKSLSGYWSLQEVNITYGDMVLNNSAINGTIYAPTGFSYACGNQTFKNDNFSAMFPAFQVQPVYKATYNTKNSKFDDPYNCVGFTTIPIWSGLFVTFILLLIMTFGLTMMMDIKTMDRFDDPKGKTITINTSE